MFNDYTLMRLAEARRAELIREAEGERLARMAQTTESSKPGRSSQVLALAAGGAALAALFIAVVH